MHVWLCHVCVCVRMCVMCVYTGQLGEVFRESISIAQTFARSYLASLDPENKFLSTTALHVHVPQVRLVCVCVCMSCVCVCVCVCVWHQYACSHV